MGISRNLRTSEPDPRSVGFAHALGLRARRRHDSGGTSARHCDYCGAAGTLDMIDMTRMRAYFTCRRCGQTWDTDRMAIYTPQ